jgi:hypothetical protein
VSEKIPPGHTSSILALQVDRTNAHAALIEPVNGVHRLIAWESASLSPEDGVAPPAVLSGIARLLGAWTPHSFPAQTPPSACIWARWWPRLILCRPCGSGSAG